MLYGRSLERDLIAGLLTGARQGRGGVLVIRGEAGIGKRSLLEDAAEQANGFHLLHGAGVESEVELAFAALRQIVGPLLDRLDQLPRPQAGALRGAFGLVDERPNPFLIELGVLSLLTGLSVERPVLCLVTDAQWLDHASADALVFVARRLEADPIVLLLAARDDSPREFLAPGLPELRLGGLDAEAARQLLEAQAGKLAPEVRDRLIEETGGNPLALVELPATLSAGQLVGDEPLPQRLPLSDRLQQVFLERVRRLPEGTQTLLLVAAAEDTGELPTVVAAGRLLAIGPEALEPAEQAGLVQISGRQLQFRHPLVRSAIYQGATFAARQTAHRTLIQAFTGEEHADRRAWHLAGATPGPDEEVARALESSADRAQRRGGPAAAAAALERAAALTPDAAARARRLVAAAWYLWEAGHGERSRALADQAEPISADATVRGRTASVRGQIELATGDPATACTLLLDGAKLLVEPDPEQATEMLVLATWAALAAGQLDRIVDEISPAVPPGRDDARIKRVADSLIAFGLGGVPPTGATEDGQQGAAAWPDPAITWIWPMLIVAEPAGDELTADQRYARSVAARRAAGTVSTLTVALADLAMAEFVLGRWAGAIGNATEGLRLARDTGQHAMGGYFLTVLAAVAANQGRADDSRRLANEALASALSLRLPVVAALASWTLASLDLSEGRPRAALDRMLSLSSPEHRTAHAPVALLATGTLVEAAARANALEGMEPRVARFERWVRSDRRGWTVMVAHRCRALISRGREAERQYRAALAAGRLTGLPFELARTELLYGQWLQRARRRAEARVHLRTALELFEGLGAIPFADQARSELRASGETARKRELGTREQLTPQELHIARLAGQGLTNREIAARLFLSPYTVGYHLHKVYAKLEITSRAELRQFDLDSSTPVRLDSRP